MKSPIFTATILAAALGAGQALADHERGDIIVRIGVGGANPGDDSNWLRLAGTELADPRVYVDDGRRTIYTSTWLLAKHRGAGRLAAIPFLRGVKVGNLPDPAGRMLVGRARLDSLEQLPPSLTVQWFPVYRESRIQPYVGLGINYSAFANKDLSGVAQGYFVGAPGAVHEADLDLGSSWGLAGELGVDISLGRDSRWLMNAAVWYLDLDSDVKIRTPASSGTRRINGKVESDPWVYSVGVGYRF